MIARFPFWSAPLCVAALTLPLRAQQPDDVLATPRTQQPVTATAGAPESSVPTADAPRVDAMLGARTPIHTAADDPEGGAYGTWAAGSTYKASFHGDFTFVPMLGGGYPRNQPFGWRTTSATVGGQPVAKLDAAERWHDDYRYEYRYGELTEAYDVLVDGVEQTFVLRTRPSHPGDFVVTGRLDTELGADPVFDRHTGIAFADAQGRTIMHYGAAVAVDAKGERSAVFTSFDGRQIHLRVPGDWLASAEFPVTIDPLLNRDCIAFWNTTNPPPVDGRVLDVDIGRDDIANQVMIAYTRQASATDTDMWVYLFSTDDPTLATRNQVFTDITTSWGDASPAIGFAGGAADSWIVAFLRLNVGGAGVHGARYHVHASGDLVVNTTFTSISRPGGSSHGTVIDVGGVASNSTGNSVFVVYERIDTGVNSEVFGKPIDLSTNTQGAEALIDSAAAGTAYTRTRPNINQVAQSDTVGWVVAYQEYWNARPGGLDDWDINIRRIDAAGVPTGIVSFPSNSTPDDRHKLTPQVSGANGFYSLGMVVWTEGTNTQTTTDLGNDVFNETFTWPLAGSFATGEICELTEGLVSDQRWRITDGTFDSNTGSHWAWAFESTLSGSQYACTSGYDSGRIERLIAYSPTGTANAFSGAVTFNDDRGEFVFAYASDEGGVACGASASTNHTVYCQRMTHLPEPAPSTYGVGCGPGTIGAVGRNLVGIRSYSITLNGATANAQAVLLLGGGPANVPLDVIGGLGCALNIDPNLLFLQIPAMTGPTGAARFVVGIPTCPSVVCGDVYWQWAYVAPGLNPLHIGATQGLRTTFVCP